MVHVRIPFDIGKPDAAAHRLLDVSAMRRLGGTAQMSLESGLADTHPDHWAQLTSESGATRRTPSLSP